MKSFSFLFISVCLPACRDVEVNTARDLRLREETSGEYLAPLSLLFAFFPVHQHLHPEAFHIVPIQGRDPTHNVPTNDRDSVSDQRVEEKEEKLSSQRRYLVLGLRSGQSRPY